MSNFSFRKHVDNLVANMQSHLILRQKLNISLGLTPRGSKTPEPIEMKLYMVDYVTHPTPHAQFG